MALEIFSLPNLQNEERMGIDFSVAYISSGMLLTELPRHCLFVAVFFFLLQKMIGQSRTDNNLPRYVLQYTCHNYLFSSMIGHV